jgi:scyllo-inositol 2-dehydrogenase (NADP+)
MIRTVVVGHGLAGRVFHAPLIRRQPDMRLCGFVVRRPEARDEVRRLWGAETTTYPDLDAALGDPAVDLVVLATPHDQHAAQTIRTLDAGKACVVDKVMALTSADADAMIAARDTSKNMLSVFHNRRWDWDFLTLRSIFATGRIGRPMLIESAVCRSSVPRSWRGSADTAGTILHDWGAHLVDQALHLGLGPCRRVWAWLAPAPWEGVDSGGHGRIVLEFDGPTLVQVETSRVCRVDRPRWWVVAEKGGFFKFGVDPQEDALKLHNDPTRATETPAQVGRLRVEETAGQVVEEEVPTVKGSWDAYYANIAAHLLRGEPLAVTAEQGREVVRVLDAAVRSAAEGVVVHGSWGGDGA